jgi:predicted membrane-bound spermidine synthase
MKAVAVLGGLIIIVLLLTSLCIIVPLVLTTKRSALSGGLPLFFYFGAIGFGFMYVEISQMQRLIVFLGHPIYGLSVVLFALLLAGGLGSALTQRLNQTSARSSIMTLVMLLLALVMFGLLTPYAVTAFRGSATPIRILVAIAIISFLGVFMGMAFPLGMRAASQRFKDLTPWFWGINGATSVCASVLAVAIALTSSISTSYWIGVVCYLVALISLLWNRRQTYALGS